MSYYGDHDIISVSAKGSTETEFTSATFSATITTHGRTGPDAKKKALPIIETLKSAILGHAEKGGIKTDHMSTTFGVDIETSRTTGEFVGYKCVYTISFTGTNVAEAPVVHDALTSIENVHAPTPVYHLNNTDEVYARAFADAVKKADTKFSDQCKALGITSDKFYVKTWSIQEEQPRGKTLSFKEGPSAKSVGVIPGKAIFNVTVNFAYSRKPQNN